MGFWDPVLPVEVELHMYFHTPQTYTGARNLKIFAISCGYSDGKD